MDLENYSDVNVLAKYKNIDPPYPQSNEMYDETHVSANNKYPITDVHILHRGYTNIIKRNEKNNLFDNSIRNSHCETIKGLNNENRDNHYDRDVLVNESYSEVNATSFAACHGSDCSCSQQTFYMTSTQLERLNRSSTKTVISIPSNGPKIKYKKYDRNNKNTKFVNNGTVTQAVDNERLSRDNQENGENITYSRPHRQYNDEFVHKTMQLNIKLQKIMRKLLIECRRKKQEETWNNYINTLKFKHGNFKDEELGTTQHNSPEYNCYTKKIEPMQKILNDIYACKDVQADSVINYGPRLDPERVYYKNNQCCYPTSPEALFKMREKENCCCCSNTNKYFRNNTIRIDKYRAIKPQLPSNNINMCNNESNCVKVLGTQTDSTEFQNSQEVCSCQEEPTDTKVKEAQRCCVEPSKESNTEEIMDPEIKHLDNIQNKLDNLVDSVNAVLLAVRALVIHRKSAEQANCKGSTHCLYDKQNIHKTEKDFITMTLQNISRPVPMSEMSTSISQFREFTMSKMHEVIHEEMEKSKKIKSDIQELLHTRYNNQGATKLTFDIPTKDSKECQEDKDKVGVSNNVIKPEDEGDNKKQITIAVNTDPLGLLALLRVSTDTIKRVLSYMLNLNSHSYISMLQQARPCTDNYICYICGESFSRPTELGEHIRQHNLRGLRDCVCHHILGVRPDESCVFKCKYCGHCFSRSYCWELHQLTCAQVYGQKHDVLPDLMFLR